MKRNWIILVTILLAFGCGAAESIEREIDCNSICSRYSDCFDESYDVSECQDKCDDNADKDRDFADKVDACENCIDDRSCSEGAFKCATACAGIVP
jgi:hypothetical protein